MNGFALPLGLEVITQPGLLIRRQSADFLVGMNTVRAACIGPPV